ncbi:hypothetical protein [Nocardia aurea]|uniref:hypothetical protein n=1 Tax=Nocardia aurea TaxID=2144174 RepID=UPI0033A882BF
MSNRMNVFSIVAQRRPSRLNDAGFCIYCVLPDCGKARCIAQHAVSEWSLCPDCGGSGYLDGHLDPENASSRCRCWGGLVESADAFPMTAEVVAKIAAMRPEPVAQAPGARIMPGSSVSWGL